MSLQRLCSVSIRIAVVAVLASAVDKPVVKVPSTYTVIESTTLQIICTSVANPTVSTDNYRWTGPGGYNITGPTLQIYNMDRNKKGNYTCTATNMLTPTGGSSQQGTGSAQVDVIVEYKPTVIVPSTYTVIEFTHLQITCTSDANPTVSSNNYRWTGPGGYNSTGPILQINNIDRNKKGDYTCTATNTLAPTGGSSQQGTGSGQVNVVVQYEPSVVVPSNFTVIEFRTLQINCKSVANPTVSINNYRWTGPGGYTSTGLTLQINNIAKSMSGNYTCMATNTLTPTNGSSQQGTGSGQVNVVIHYGPGTSVGFGSGQSSLRLPEGSRSWSETCTADCNPACDYSWRKGSSAVSSTSVCRINNVTRADDGVYTCVAHNGVGEESTKDLTLTVIYMDQPTFTVDKFNVTENETVTMRCQVNSEPAAWTVIRKRDNGTTLSDNMTNNKTFVISKADCLDRGIYICISSNQEILKTYIRSQQITVLCSPRVDYRKRVTYIFAKNIHETVEFVVPVIAFPEPTYTWYRLVENNNLEKISESTIYEQIDKGQMTTLRINLTSDKDYGKYALKIVNNEGKKQLEFSLTPAGNPYPPESLNIQSKTMESVRLSWISGFNGGSNQTFNLIYTTDSDDSFEKWDKWNTDIVDPGRGKHVYENVTGLTSGTKYTFAIFSTNRFGQSNYLRSEAVTTKDLRKGENVKHGLSSGAGIGVGFVIGFILATGIWLGIHILRKKSPLCNKNVKKQHRNADNEDVVADATSVTTAQAGKNEYEGLSETPDDQQAYENIQLYEDVENKTNTNNQSTKTK